MKKSPLSFTRSEREGPSKITKKINYQLNIMKAKAKSIYLKWMTNQNTNEAEIKPWLNYNKMYTNLL
jgi:hypothetical protein